MQPLSGNVLIIKMLVLLISNEDWKQERSGHSA